MLLSELARHVGVAKSTVSGYLNLTGESPLNRAGDFAKVLGIKTEYLLGSAEREESIKQDTIAAHLDGDLTEEGLIGIRKCAELVRKAHRNR